MKLVPLPHSDLPLLAWLAEVSEEETRLFHGTGVDVFEEGFFEGAWNGPFAERGFLGADCCMGSGGRVLAGGLEVTTPCHPLEGLFVFVQPGRTLVSPSLAAVLARSGQRLDQECLCYQQLVLRPLYGEAHRVSALPLMGGGTVTILRMRRARIEAGGVSRLRPAFAAPAFPQFEDYRRFLQEALGGLAANAMDPSRQRRHPPLTTVSSGYDSAACAALGREIGCTEAVTIREGRPLRAADGPADLEDSGRQVGEALGLTVREHGREDYRRQEGLVEAEFVASGDLGQDLVLAAFAEEVPGRMLLTGFHGDVVWSRRVPHRPRRELVRGDPSGASLSEFRLRTGFIHVPVPCLGASAMPDLLAISRSPSMRPWSLGTSYDRPIPRRLVEEAGVPRPLFGHKKQAVTVLLGEGAEERLGRASAQDFRAYQEEMGHVRRGWPAQWQKGTACLHRGWQRLLGPCNKILKRVPLGLRVGSPVPLRWRDRPGVSTHLMHWGLHHLRGRYRCLEP